MDEAVVAIKIEKKKLWLDQVCDNFKKLHSLITFALF